MSKKSFISALLIATISTVSFSLPVQAKDNDIQFAPSIPDTQSFEELKDSDLHDLFNAPELKFLGIDQRKEFIKQLLQEITNTLIEIIEHTGHPMSQYSIDFMSSLIQGLAHIVDAMPII